MSLFTSYSDSRDRLTVFVLIGVATLASHAGAKAQSAQELEIDTIVECTFAAANEDSHVLLTYHPEETSEPVSTRWEFQTTIEGHGALVLHAGWHLPGYNESFQSHAQFSAKLTPFTTGPKLARIEIHPWAFRYNHWGMRFGAISERVGDNDYSATGHWPTLVSLEGQADKLFIRVQSISNDPANANSELRAIMSAELPVGLFSRANRLAADATAEGNALLAAGMLDCIDKPNPPIVVT